MKPSVLIVGIFITMLSLTPFKAATAGLRCGARLITVGDYQDRVLSECGEPDHVQAWEEERIYGFDHHPLYYGVYDNYEYVRPGQGAGRPRPYRIRKLVIVEQWTYNHGPSRFLNHLRLENGIVRSIVSGDYGY